MSNLSTQSASSALSTWDDSQIAIIKQQIAKGCSDGELALFGQVCTKTGLDPFSRQIYAISRGGKMSIQVSIDGFRTIAARSNLYGGSMTEWCGEDGVWRDVWLSTKSPAAAKTTVWRKGSPQPFTGVARFAAYQQGNSMWSKMPDVMIGKVSESLALRKAFPAELSGLYSSEEMEQADVPIPTKIDTPQPKAIAPYSEDIQTRQQALRECMEILEYDADEKASFAKSICPRPFATWTLNEWDLAVVKALSAIDMMNSEPVMSEVVA
jgi:phage recombination protein Bet